MSILDDALLSLRRLRNNPAFATAAVLILSLGIGANTAAFAVVDALLLRPIGGVPSDRLVGLYDRSEGPTASYRAFSYADYLEIRERSAAFENVLAHRFAMVGVAEGDGTRRAFAAIVSSNYFETLGVALLRGRPFSADEESPTGSLSVAIISYPMWRRLGEPAGVPGFGVRLNGRPFSVVGVAPPGFTGTTALVSPEIWLPLGSQVAGLGDSQARQADGQDPLFASDRDLALVGRLKGDVSYESAEAETRLLGARRALAHPAEDQGRTLVLAPLSRLSVGADPQDDRQVVALGGALLALSAIVLLVASLNLANMLMARAEVRQKEVALRLALGSGAWLVVRQFLVEGSLVAALGGIAGTWLAFGLTGALFGSLATISPVALVFPPTPSPSVLAATVGFGVVAALVSSFGPAVAAARRDILPWLKGSGTTMNSSRKSAAFRAPILRNAAIVLQIALSLALLAAAGLLIRSGSRAAESDPGFPLEAGLIFELDPSMAGYGRARAINLYRDLLQRVRALPQVEAASLASAVPFGIRSDARRVRRLEQPETDDSGAPLGVDSEYVAITSGYFRSLGVGLLRGREFDASEETLAASSSPRHAIISAPLAARLFGGANPVGQMIRYQGDAAERIGSAGPAPDPVVQIVGVAPGFRQRVLDEGPEPFLYVPVSPHSQMAMNLHIRTRDDPAVALAAVRHEIHSLDRNLPMVSASTLSQFRAANPTLLIARTGARLLTLVGLAALVLAATGLYGVRSYTIGRRTREIGVRMALGAAPGRVTRELVIEGAVIGGAGIALGLLLAIAVGGLLRSMLYEVHQADPLVILLSVAALGGAALAASYLPARRASLISPSAALRIE